MSGSLRNARSTDEMLPDEDRLIDEGPEVEAADAPSDSELSNVRALARQYLDLESEIEDLSARLAAKNLALKSLKETALPLAMTACGLTSFDLVGGGTVSVKDYVRAGITEANRPAAFAALEKNEHGDIIKHEITVLFGRGEEAWARKFLADLAKRKKPLNVSRRDFVEWQTLTKLAKELVAAERAQGKDPKESLPDNLYGLIGVYEAKVADVKLPKAKP